MELKFWTTAFALWFKTLLIVPYGIEIILLCKRNLGSNAFNRTLWNWNFIGTFHAVCDKPFNRTLWNWNAISSGSKENGHILLIVPYGIEIWKNKSWMFKRLLLIVPYGIEIWTGKISPALAVLLIVPYGIEISKGKQK